MGAPPNFSPRWKPGKTERQAARQAGRRRSEGAERRDEGGRGEEKEALVRAALGPAGAPPAPGRLIKRRRRLTSVGS